MLPILLSFAIPVIAIAAVAQLSETPPVNMGLWQTEITAKATGIENTPMAAMASALGGQHVTQGCLTRERWKSDIQGFNARQQHSCTLSNVHQDAHEISFDESCEGGSNNTHVDILIDSDEHAHGTMVMKVTAPSLPQPMTINYVLVSHYLGSDCGDVKPGEGKMIK